MAPQPAPPAKPPPEDLDHHSRVPLLLGVQITLAVVTLLVILTRFYSRTVVKRFLGSDDWIMGVAATLSISVAIIQCYGTRYGGGKHTWDVEMQSGFDAAKLAWVTQVLFPLTVSSTKISICVAYLRFLPFKANRLFCYCTIVYLVCYCIATTFLAVFMCHPISAFWDTSVHGKCFGVRSVLLVPAALNSVTDVIVYLWPARTLWNIKQPPLQRFGVIFVFVVGCMVCIAGICRIWYLVQLWKSNDIFYEGAMVYIITSVEISGGIIFGSLPALKPLLARLMPSIFGSSPVTHLAGITITKEGQESRPWGWNHRHSVRLHSPSSHASSVVNGENVVDDPETGGPKGRQNTSTNGPKEITAVELSVR